SGRRPGGLFSSVPYQGESAMSIKRIEVGSRLSAAVVFNGVVYLAGQVPTDTSLDIEGQTRQVLDAIDALLAQAGTNKTRLLTAQIYLADLADFKGMNAQWEKWVSPGNTPARATVQAKLVDPGFKIEIVATAAA